MPSTVQGSTKVVMYHGIMSLLNPYHVAITKTEKKAHAERISTTHPPPTPKKQEKRVRRIRPQINPLPPPHHTRIPTSGLQIYVLSPVNLCN